jgi:hypothetical protein
LLLPAPSTLAVRTADERKAYRKHGTREAGTPHRRENPWQKTGTMPMSPFWLCSIISAVPRLQKDWRDALRMCADDEVAYRAHHKCIALRANLYDLLSLENVSGFWETKCSDRWLRVSALRLLSSV